MLFIHHCISALHHEYVLLLCIIFMKIKSKKRGILFKFRAPHWCRGHIPFADSFRGMRHDTDSLNLCRGKNSAAHILPFHLATFIILSSLRSLQSSIISASLFALLVFGTDLTTALQWGLWGQGCINTHVFLLLFHLQGV